MALGEIPGRPSTEPRSRPRPWPAITELSGALAEGAPGSLPLFEKLTGDDQLRWRCCRDAAQSQPDWLSHDDHDRALRLISDTELQASHGAVSRAAKAADLVSGALAEAASGMSQALTRAAGCWADSPAVLMAGGESFSPEKAAASAAPHLRERVARVLACLDSVTTDAGQAMVAICALLLAAGQPDAGRVVRVPVVFARPGERPASRGVAGTLELREFPPGPTGLFPDPRGMRNRRADAAFDAGLRLAWQFAAGASRRGRCVLWSLSLDEGVPDYAIDGGSLGAAFAVALRELLRRPRGSRPGLFAVPRAFFVGLRPSARSPASLPCSSPQPTDQVTPRAADGPWLDRVGDMDAKLDAAQAKGLRLVAPAANRASAQPRAIVHVDWAETIHQADRYARRVRPMRIIVTAIAILAVAGTSAGVGAAVQARSAEGVQVDRADAQAALQRDIAASRQLADRSEAIGDSDPALARLLSIAAWRICPSSAARYAMLAAAALPGIAVLKAPAPFATSIDPELGVGHVTSVAFSPDGKTLAGGTADGSVVLWDVATRRQVGVLTSAAGGIQAWSVAFSPDGKTLAAGDLDGTVTLWDVTTHRQVAALTAPGAVTVTSVAFSPDGKTLASDGIGYKVRPMVWLWDVATRRQVSAPLTGHTGQVNSVAFSPDGATLATGSDDRTARLWDVATRRQVGAPLTGYTGGVSSVAFSPDGKTLATGSLDGTVRLWDVATRRQVGAPLTGHTGGVTSVVFSPDGTTLAFGSNDGTVTLWDTVTSHQVGTPLAGHARQVELGGVQPGRHHACHRRQRWHGAALERGRHRSAGRPPLWSDRRDRACGVQPGRQDPGRQ